MSAAIIEQNRERIGGHSSGCRAWHNSTIRHQVMKVDNRDGNITSMYLISTDLHTPELEMLRGHIRVIWAWACDTEYGNAASLHITHQRLVGPRDDSVVAQ